MRYPTKGAQLVSPYEIWDTPTWEDINRRRTIENHHGWFPRTEYNTRIEKMFRGLVTHVYPLYIPEHRDLHTGFDAPRKPKEAEMVEVLDEYIATRGALHVVLEKRTRDHYTVEPEQWDRIRQHQRLEFNGVQL